MYATISADIKDRPTTFPSSPTSLRTETVQDEEQERAPAPSRFAAAQQLFKRQQTVPPKPPAPPFIPPQSITPTSPTRIRSFTASSSLYSKIGQSIQAETTDFEEGTRAVSSPERMAFRHSFGQPKPQHTIQPPPAAETSAEERESPIDPQCILPGHNYTMQRFDFTTISGRTGTNKAAWWCRHDKLVVFDGLTSPEDESDVDRQSKRLLVRTSKGLEIARRNCKKEAIHVDISCGHCRGVLGRETWYFEARVKKSRVCGECQERCWREVESLQAEELENEKADGRRDSYFDAEGERGEDE
ncbi:hypothetical protein BLS_007662 [Venturia inaequalis]|uniref:Uncharacterized protein n=1 Tax=Venturia inaequalis TaxID=5025 RepID=A0A8H3ZC34_VENIN|nr:hypothetical protein BLS_007662 [Venturia inaequalis]KAE9987897.1 hypothetical protein EG328_001324 [Venturia inaequalis]KAE9991154.1 hypothetical protein EG327_000395 [Venturia inaequalis]